VGVPLLMAADDGRKKLKSALRPRRPRPDWAGPPLECSERLRKILTRHYLLARHAARAMPVAWITTGAPVEILRTLGFYTVYPENHGALCGARKVGVAMSEPAEKAGYSQDLCSYARIDLGLALGARSPVGALPKPDLVVCCNNICQTVLFWYRQLAQHYGIPLLLIDTPFVEGELDEGMVRYVADQIRSLVPQLEGISRQRLDSERLTEVLRRAKNTSDLWGKVLRTLSHRPAPMTIFDAFAHMAPVVSLRGLPVAEAYFETLLAELEGRIRRGIGALTHEKHRLLWDNIAVWFKVADFARKFGQAGCAFVAATYTNAWAETAHYLDVNAPYESMAKTYSMVILNRGLDHRFALMKKMVEDFAIDGLVLHSTRSCKPYSLGQYDMRRRFVEECGLPALLIEADTTDPRSYAEGPTATRIEAFLETLESHAAAGHDKRGSHE
jgi:benzoyl-CoA reductase/2-hydroxyglutaryl-CoA dehydratase subunit BcrC/BadD/HgdB